MPLSTGCLEWGEIEWKNAPDFEVEIRGQPIGYCGFADAYILFAA
jgi:hypothetical protein